MGRGRNDYRNYQNQNYNNFYYEEASNVNLFYGRILAGYMGYISDYTQEIQEKAIKAAKRIQTQMLNEITNVSPVRKYTPKRSRITDRKEPGYFKQGWTRLTLTQNDGSLKRIRGQSYDDIFFADYIYAVRNKNEPMLVHLLNFDHDTVAHGVRYRNASKGTHFAENVQEKYQEEFSKEIEKILN